MTPSASPGTPWAVSYRGAIRTAIAAHDDQWIIYMAETDRTDEETTPNLRFLAPLTPERPIFLTETT